MKYQCLESDCKRTFVHPAKLREHRQKELLIPRTQAPVIPNDFDSVETEIYVCPHCKSLNFDEFVEPEADITSVKSVPLEEVDSYLKQGYKVRELYAKNATLIKTETKIEILGTMSNSQRTITEALLKSATDIPEDEPTEASK